MDIRQAKNTDFNAIHELVTVAFQTAEMPPDDEQSFVLRLRAGDTYLPELELVATSNNEIIGHIMFAKLNVRTDDGEYTGLLLAPLAVKLEYRNQGIGGRLVYAGFEAAAELGYTSVFLAGNPKYYGRFGFKEIGELGIENKTTIPDQFVLGCEIAEGSLKDVKGYIDYLG